VIRSDPTGSDPILCLSEPKYVAEFLIFTIDYQYVLFIDQSDHNGSINTSYIGIAYWLCDAPTSLTLTIVRSAHTVCFVFIWEETATWFL
jgi:hypothetical protein